MSTTPDIHRRGRHPGPDRHGRSTDEWLRLAADGLMAIACLGILGVLALVAMSAL